MKKKPGELFEEFYEKQNGQPMKKEQKEFSMELIRKIWEEEVASKEALTLRE